MTNKRMMSQTGTAAPPTRGSAASEIGDWEGELIARGLQVAGCRLQVRKGEKRRPENKDGAVQTLREVERLGNWRSFRGGVGWRCVGGRCIRGWNRICGRRCRR